jgi:hypothetical protein
MKRKLDENDAPSVEVAEADKKEVTFADFNLDPKILQAISAAQLRTPTLVQQKAIPLSLDGVDVIAKARTGSGKTAAYVLPILEALLKRKKQVGYSIEGWPPLLLTAIQGIHTLYCRPHPRSNSRVSRPSHKGRRIFHGFLLQGDPGCQALRSCSRCRIQVAPVQLARHRHRDTGQGVAQYQELGAFC